MHFQQQKVNFRLKGMVSSGDADQLKDKSNRYFFENNTHREALYVSASSIRCKLGMPLPKRCWEEVMAS